MMRIADLKLKDLLRRMKNIHERLCTPEGFDTIVDATREDTPIIEEILIQLLLMRNAKASRSLRQAKEKAQRDLLVLLALREIGQEENARVELRMRACAN